MPIGGSLFLIAVGAILKFAVSDHVNGVNLGVVGVILMIVGGVGLVISVIWMTSRRRTDVIERDATGRRSTSYVQPNDGPY